MDVVYRHGGIRKLIGDALIRALPSFRSRTSRLYLRGTSRVMVVGWCDGVRLALVQNWASSGCFAWAKFGCFTQAII
jgi:hypothetical protein